MKARVLTLIAALYLSGCGAMPTPQYTVDSPQMPASHDSRFDVYIHLFQEDADRYGVYVDPTTVAVRFNTPPWGALGYCHIDDLVRTVDISPEAWRTSSVTGRRLLIYHELGHCLLEKAHVINKTDIMNPALIMPQVFVKDEEKLLSNFFDFSTFWTL